MFPHRLFGSLLRWFQPGIVPLVAGALIGGGASLLGGILGNRASARQADTAYDRNLHLANTAHTREVADLRQAGLNPILSATGGSGAVSNAAQVAQQQDVVTPAVSSALRSQEVDNATKLNAELVEKAGHEKRTADYLSRIEKNNMRMSNMALNWAEESPKMEGAYTHTNWMKKLDAELGFLKANARNTNANAANAELMRPGLSNEARMQEGPLGDYLPYIQRLLDAASGGSSAYRNFKLPNAR